MYVFEAHYIDMDTEIELIRNIEFDGQFFDTEKDCYLYAMGLAYDMRKKNEAFSHLDFIAG